MNYYRLEIFCYKCGTRVTIYLNFVFEETPRYGKKKIFKYPNKLPEYFVAGLLGMERSFLPGNPNKAFFESTDLYQTSESNSLANQIHRPLCYKCYKEILDKHQIEKLKE